MNTNEFLENNCFPLCWLEDEEQYQPALPVERKDLATLLSELEDIKNRIDEISAKEWLLAKKMKFLKANFNEL